MSKNLFSWASIALLVFITAAHLPLSMAGSLKDRHTRIDVVPTLGQVVVDGQLNDWDLSGSLNGVYVKSLAPKFTVKISLMYDAKALYIAAHFVDDTPLKNEHDPVIEPNKGWAGDALQIRLCTDSTEPYPLPQFINKDSICHMTMWQYTQTRQPALNISYGMDFHGTKLYTGKDSGLVFKVDADGQGYVLEGRISWKRLGVTNQPPQGGDKIALTVQPLWGNASGLKYVCTLTDVVIGAGVPFQNASVWGQAVFSKIGHLSPRQRELTIEQTTKPLALNLSLPDNHARVISVAIYNQDDTLVRTLPVKLRTADSLSKKLLINWDGLDDDGKPLPVGKYIAKLLTHRGIGQKWITSVHSAGNPPWPTDDGTGAWGGDHGDPIAAASDGKQVYLGWGISEEGRAVIAIKKEFTSDGKVQKLWGQRHAHEYALATNALATNGKLVFAAQDGVRWGQITKGPYSSDIIMWDAATGRPKNFPFGKRAIVVSKWDDSIKPKDIQTYDDRSSQYHPRIPHKRFFERMRDHDFGPEELGLRALEAYGPNLLGLAVAGDQLYASLYLENKVVVLNWKTGEHVKEISVKRPVGLAVARDKTLLVVSDHTVVRIDPASGQVTPWISEVLDHPWGLALDKDQHLYVTDCGKAMQVKVFDETGKRIGSIGKAGGRPWIGRYDPKGMLRPAGITVDAEGKVWVAEHDGTPRRISVWSKKGKLLADLLGPGAYAVGMQADLANPNLVNVHDTLFEVNYETGKVKTLSTLIRPQMKGMGFMPDAAEFMGRALAFRHTRGKDYLVARGRGGTVLYQMNKDLEAYPVVAMASRADVLGLMGFAKVDLPSNLQARYWKNAWKDSFLWTDINGDGLYQPKEMIVETNKPTPWGRPGLTWGGWVDNDLTLWNASNGHGYVWRIPVQKWLDNGTPVYPKPSEQKPLFKAIGNTFISIMPMGKSVYLLEQQGGSPQSGKGAKWSAISRYTLKGKRQWAYRRAWLGFGHESPLSRAGDVVGAMKFIGNATLNNNVTLIAVNGYYGQFNLLSDQGLWVASLGTDMRYGPNAGPNVILQENFAGFFYKNKNNGKYYLMAGDTDARIWEVTGLQTIRTAKVELAITAEEYAKVQIAVQRTRGGKVQRKPLQLAAAKSISIDGNLTDWDMGHAAKFDAGNHRSAKIAMAYDQNNLMVAFDVQDPSPMQNTLKETPLLAFKTGDVCDLMLGVDPKADATRTKPVAGDMRISFVSTQGKGICIIYEPVIKAGTLKQPHAFTSPVGALHFDRVKVVAQAKVVVHRQAKGYTLEASIPLKILGFTPKLGMKIRGDVGIIFSNKGGSRSILRKYYANQHTGIINDIPSEARLEPKNWIAVEVK